MAQLPNTVVQTLNKKFQGASAGQLAGFQAAAGGGDHIPLNGKGTLFTIKTSGTATVATLNSTRQSEYGTDQDITITMGATEEREVFIENDGRFDAGGVNAGFCAVTYTAVTGVTVKAKVIPG